MLYNDNIKQFYIINQLQITIKNKFIDFYNIFLLHFIIIILKVVITVISNELTV